MTQGASLFEDDAAVDIVITAPFRQINRTDDKERGIPGKLTTGDQSIPVVLQVRGNYRLNNCQNAPLRLNFTKEDVDGTLFDGQRELKLVRQCGRSSSHADYVRLEYLAYLMLAELSPYHFRVRWLDATFVDEDRPDKAQPEAAFLIERKKKLEHRLELHHIDESSVRVSSLSPEAAATVDLFQYLVGNTDYSILRSPDDGGCCHNVKMLATDKSKLADLIPVPYDFDHAGLVNASYAKPPDMIDITRVTQRKYRGFCDFNEAARGAAAHFAGRYDTLVALVEDDALLSSGRKKQALKFLAAFQRNITEPRRFEREIINACR